MQGKDKKVLTKDARSPKSRCVELLSGRNSGVECQLPKLNVVGSNPIARFSTIFLLIETSIRCTLYFWSLNHIDKR